MHKLNYHRPCLIYQYSNIAPRFSGQTSIFGAVFFLQVSLGNWETKATTVKKTAILTRRPRCQVRILIYRTWPFRDVNSNSVFRLAGAKPCDVTSCQRISGYDVLLPPGVMFTKFSKLLWEHSKHQEHTCTLNMNCSRRLRLFLTIH